MPKTGPVTEQVSPVSDSSENPDSDVFYELRSTKTIKLHQILDPAKSDPIYTIKEYERAFTPKKPDITLYAGRDKTFPVVGVVKIHAGYSRHHTIGIGDPDAVLPEDEEDGEKMIWEGLRRVKKWTFRHYSFEYGERQERKFYTWRRTVDRMLRQFKEMELRVGGPEETNGEVVAMWKGTDWKNLKRGNLFIRKSNATEAERKRWEVMVLLSSQSIIETTVRRNK